MIAMSDSAAAGGLMLLWTMVHPAPHLLAATILGSYFLAWGTVDPAGRGRG